MHRNSNASDSVPILKGDGIFPEYGSIGTVNDDDVKSPFKSINNSEVPESSETANPENPKIQNPLHILRLLTVEPFLFLYMFSYMMKSSVITNMIMDKACSVHLNYSQEVCRNLSFYTEEKNEVETMANDYNLYLTLIQMGPSALLILFFGQWSDKYGRKPPLIFALLGAILDGVGLLLVTYYFYTRLEYLLLTAIPSGLMGGLICTLTIVYSHASDVTTSKRRTIKYLFVELSFGLGISLGTLAGGLVYKYYSYIAVYSVTIAGLLLSLLLVIFMVKETRGLDSTASLSKKLCDVFSVKNFFVGFQVCMKVRENHGRAQIWLLLGSVSAIVLTYASFASIAYTYVHHMFNWDPTIASEVSTIFSAIGMIVCVLCVPVFIRVLKFGDAKLGVLGTMSSIGKNVCIGLAFKPWIYYLGSSFGMFSGLATFPVRSILSKLVAPDELGKVFSFLSACESLIPVFGNLAITKIFNATLETFPGACYIIGAVLLTLPLGVFIWISRLTPKEYDFRKNVTQKLVPDIIDQKSLKS